MSKYTDLLRRSLTGEIEQDDGLRMDSGRAGHFSHHIRDEGADWPVKALTMIGGRRMHDLESCVREVLREDVPGDLMETGVWRGGACILMRGILEDFGDLDRKVWVADSFEGLPPPDTEKYPADEGLDFHKIPQLAVSLSEVQDNFRRYALLDKRVVFVKGWFRDTLPACDVEQLAVLRLDGDLYESTIIALESLYPKLSIGGYLIIDDFALPACELAVHHFRAKAGVMEAMVNVGVSMRWRKGKG